MLVPQPVPLQNCAEGVALAGIHGDVCQVLLESFVLRPWAAGSGGGGIGAWHGGCDVGVFVRLGCCTRYQSLRMA